MKLASKGRAQGGMLYVHALTLSVFQGTLAWPVGVKKGIWDSVLRFCSGLRPSTLTCPETHGSSEGADRCGLIVALPLNSSVAQGLSLQHGESCSLVCQVGK